MLLAKVGPDAIRRARQRFVFQDVGSDQSIEEPPAFAFLRRHRAAGVEKLGRAALADDPGQDRAGAHIAAGEADAVE